MSIAESISAGALWLSAARWMSRATTVVGSIVLARLLSPADYGVVAIAASVLALITGLASLPTIANLVRVEALTRDHLDTAFTIAAIRGLLIALVVLLGSSTIAHTAGYPELTVVLQAMALIPLLDALQSPRMAAFDRDLDFSRKAIKEATVAISSMAIAITIAVTLRNYWALVLGTIGSMFIGLVLSYWMAPYRPAYSLARFAEHFAFSGWLWMSNATRTVAMRIDGLLIGRFLDAQTTGIYVMARDIATIPAFEAMQPITNTLFPAFSRVARERRDNRAMALESMAVVSSFAFASSVGTALIAPELVRVLLGAQWSAAAPLMQILLPGWALMATMAGGRALVQSDGLTRPLFFTDLGYSILRVIAFGYGLYLGDIFLAVVGIAAMTLLHIVFQLVLISTTVQLHIGKVLRAIHRPVLAALAMALAIRLLESHLPGIASLADASTGLVLKLAVGGATYIGVHAGLWWLEGRPEHGAEYRLGTLAQKALARLRTR